MTGRARDLLASALLLTVAAVAVYSSVAALGESLEVEGLLGHERRLLSLSESGTETDAPLFPAYLNRAIVNGQQLQTHESSANHAQFLQPEVEESDPVRNDVEVVEKMAKPCSRAPRNYMFGYGSLVNARSRTKTADTGAAIPVRVSGLERAWDYAQQRRSMTALGAVFKPGSTVNGVIVMVAESSLPKFDAREVEYSRKLVPVESVSVVNAADQSNPDFCLHPDDKVWVYIVNNAVEPSCPLPIAQSYVDVVMEGFLSYGEEFAREFIHSTKSWDCISACTSKYTWIDDRSNPLIYERNFVSPAKQKLIDRLLQSLLPDQFLRRRHVDSHDCALSHKAAPVFF